jgi:hypothetical protein
MAPVLALIPLLFAATVAPIGLAANGTTLPFQRHVVRLGPPTAGHGTFVAAVQKQNSDGEGLVLYVSNDNGASWQRDQPVQRNASIRDTADMLVDRDGFGFSLVYGVEPQSSQFSPNGAPVVYLHYKLLPDRRVGADLGPSVVFQAGSGEGYFRPSITRDSSGVLHASATLLSRGTFHFIEKTSSDGLHWSSSIEIASFGATFGGGRLIAYANNVMAIFDSYAPSAPGRYRVKATGAVDWSATHSFAPDGLYHAGAFSAVATPDGHVHLAYSEKSFSQLRYREFNGSSWSGSTTIEHVGYWSNQPALSRSGNAIVCSWNHRDGTDATRIEVANRSGTSFVSAQTVSSGGFKGYTTALEEIAPGDPLIVLWSEQAKINVTPAYVKSATIWR